MPSKSNDNIGYKSAAQFYDKKYSFNYNNGNYNFDNTEKFQEIDEEIQELENKYQLNDL